VSRRVARRYLPHVLLAVVALVNLLPLYYMGVSSLQRGGEHFDAGRLLPPLDPAWENFERLFSENGFGRLFVNSVVVTAAAVGVGTLAAVFGAYAFTRIRTRAAGALFNMTVACLAIPPIVVLVPLFLLAADAGLINNMLAPIVIYVGFIMPFSILLLKNFFDEIPRELLQAARVEGASPVQELWHVILPLSRAPLVALGVVNALWVWNELLISIVFLQDEQQRTLQAGIAFFAGRNVVDIPMTMAGSLVATVPILLAFILGQRYFVRGLTGGAIKS
jgi:ABC-type glycerol-3-phosphate transport system permease component